MERYPRQRLDNSRWQCVARPQYRYSCAISCLVSIFNHLFSRDITLDECIAILFPDLKEDPQHYDFGPQASNSAVQNWFKVLCMHHGLSGTSYTIYKEQGRTRTACSKQEALRNIISALNTPRCALLYHCLNHYCIIVGYIISPSTPNKLGNNCVFSGDDGCTLKLLYTDGTEAEDVDDSNIWLIVADCGKGTAPLRSLTWDFVHKDISTRPPYAYNARCPERGLLRKTDSRGYLPVEVDSVLVNNTIGYPCVRPGSVIKGSSHCIIGFVGD
ncbi:Basic, immunoglobulin-like variable motif-containing protein [Giardia lamblia P15]|uniref:Basic, immunoglobulin-like variable motif-containing protein n=1 Tax=Giardia intestinalis (strain P15) TaxID=658858 RepID=E1F5L9_GIAIA|nr:Basic, immunoglobulin-like variable motif-containing protein [Giardia lamblia P15]